MMALVALAGAAAAQNKQAAGQAAKTAKPAQAAHQSPDEAKLKEELVKLEEQSWVAWKGRDGKFFEGFLSDDHVEMGVGGPSNKAEVVAFVASPICVVASYSVGQFQLTVLGPDAALLTYHAEQDTKCHAAVPSPAWVTSLYVRRNGRWLNAVYQQTPASK
jgi:hypothetical protein